MLTRVGRQALSHGRLQASHGQWSAKRGRLTQASIPDRRVSRPCVKWAAHLVAPYGALEDEVHPVLQSIWETRLFIVHWEKTAAVEEIPLHAVVRVNACEAG